MSKSILSLCLWFISLLSDTYCCHPMTSVVNSLKASTWNNRYPLWGFNIYFFLNLSNALKSFKPNDLSFLIFCTLRPQAQNFSNHWKSHSPNIVLLYFSNFTSFSLLLSLSLSPPFLLLLFLTHFFLWLPCPPRFCEINCSTLTCKNFLKFILPS